LSFITLKYGIFTGNANTGRWRERGVKCGSFPAKTGYLTRMARKKKLIEKEQKEVKRITSAPSIISEITAVSSENISGVPEITTMSPENIRGVPEITTVSPENISGVPEITTVSPENISGVPEITTVSPENISGVPEITTVSPENISKITAVSPENISAHETDSG
uniref:Uncharacterized protein n=1 Tax=Gouania willdenowi TaxID=441366 RepID=A0A8C5EXB2_GOUWI